MTTASHPVFNQVNLIVRDLDAALAFYRLLGLPVPRDPATDWPPGSGARHADLTMPGGLRLELDNEEMAGLWHGSLREAGERGPEAGIVLNFSLPSREAVDERYAELTAAGHPGRRRPDDAFWGARYAIVQDPDGNDVGLMSPVDEARRFQPQA